MTQEHTYEDIARILVAPDPQNSHLSAIYPFSTNEFGLLVQPDLLLVPGANPEAASTLTEAIVAKFDTLHPKTEGVLGLPYGRLDTTGTRFARLAAQQAELPFHAIDPANIDREPTKWEAPLKEDASWTIVTGSLDVRSLGQVQYVIEQLNQRCIRVDSVLPIVYFANVKILRELGRMGIELASMTSACAITANRIFEEKYADQTGRVNHDVLKSNYGKIPVLA